jgi:hypothetical protein
MLLLFFLLVATWLLSVRLLLYLICAAVRALFSHTYNAMQTETSTGSCGGYGAGQTAALPTSRQRLG